jgi:hypothetical protein
MDRKRRSIVAAIAAGALVALTATAGQVAPASADCNTLADCAIQQGEATVAAAQQEVTCVQGQLSNPNPAAGDQVCQTVGSAAQTANGQLTKAQQEVACLQGQLQSPNPSGGDQACQAVGGALKSAQDLESQITGLAAPYVARAQGAVTDVQTGGLVEVCAFQGRWSASTGIATGPIDCAGWPFGKGGTPRVETGTFTTTLVKNYAYGTTSGCAYELKSPPFGNPAAYGTWTLPSGTYKVALAGTTDGGPGLGLDGNSYGVAAWYDSAHNDANDVGVDVMTAVPVSALTGPSVSPTCNHGDEFVDGVLVLSVA